MAPKRDVENADTLPPEEEEDSAEVPPTRPSLSGWDHYEVLDSIGRGGMGEVYRARDRVLGRIVAIKFILNADPNLMMRFSSEAKAQAKIDHPNVCRIYEVGELGGRAYIALQLIDGAPLHKVAPEMSLDEKIAVMRDVASAVHAAHQQGIVHRDLKPANVMVERKEGRWFPVVMDFGLARESSVDLGLTQSGVPLGTPAYMSPEQARGDVHAIDEHSDIYSLGATLFELLTGRVPFPTTSWAETLLSVLNDEPPSPRRLVPGLPADLDTITLKCLAKDPAQRYPSARALADDFVRYLAREPIQGRRLPLWQRVARRARRHRGLVTLGAASLVIIGVVAGLAIRERVLAAERAHFAERLGGEAKAIESHLREAYGRPLHDTRPDRQRVRAQMATIAVADKGRDEIGEAIVHDALGRGYLALHDWQSAADELGHAIAAGWQAPGLHAARGRALGEIYRRALEEVRVTAAEDSRSGASWYARRRQEVVQQYLTPALVELEWSRAAGEDTELLDALIALYTRDFATAEARARQVPDDSPESPDAHKLVADAIYGAAIEAFDHGDFETARTGLENATAQYDLAIEYARSDASVHEAAAQAWLSRAELDFRQVRSSRDALDRALTVIDEHALSADPSDARAYALKSHVLLRQLRIPRLLKPDEKDGVLERGMKAAERAVDLDPRDVRTRTSLGAAYVIAGGYAGYHGQPGRPWFERARQQLEQAVALQPANLQANNGLGTAHRWLGDDLASSGGDPMPDYQLALRSYRKAAEIDASFLPACQYETEMHAQIAEHEANLKQDPRPAADDAQRTAERCLRIDPKLYFVLDSVARAEIAVAQFQVEQKTSPVDALRRARAALDRDEAIHPEHVTIFYVRATAARVEATDLLQRGIDPAHAIGEGRDALTSGFRIEPDNAFCWTEAARLALIEARWARHDHAAARPLLLQALAQARHAEQQNDKLADAKLVLAEVHLELASLQPGGEHLPEARKYLDKAASLNPRLPGLDRASERLADLDRR